MVVAWLLGPGMVIGRSQYNPILAHATRVSSAWVILTYSSTQTWSFERRSIPLSGRRLPRATR